MPSTLSDPFLLAAVWTGVAAVIATLCLVTAIVVLRVRLTQRERRWRAFVDRWRPALLEAILDPAAPGHLPVLAAGEHTLFLRLWAYLHESVRGDAATKLNDTARTLRIDATARGLLESGGRAEQLQAVLAAGYLQDEQAWAALVRLARSADSLVSVHAARALVRINPLRAANGLMPLIALRQDWDVARVAGLLAEARQPFWLLMAKVIPNLQASELPRTLMLAEALQVQLPDATVARLLQPGQPPRVIEAALRLADSLAVANDVRRCLRHEDAGVREQAVRRIASAAGPQDARQIAALLADTQWSIRMAAARTLTRLPFVQDADLAALQASYPMADDVLRHVLAERKAMP